MRTNKPFRSRTAQLVVVLLHLSLLPGMWVAVQIGRPRFVGLGTVVLTAVIVFDLLIVVSRFSNDRDRSIDQSASMSWISDQRFVWSLLIFAAAALVLLDEVVFYVLVSVAFLLVFYRIVSLERGTRSASADLFLVAGGSLSLIGSQVFRVPYYYGVSDTIIHTSIAVDILTTNGLDSVASTRYGAYPIYHVLSSIGIRQTALQPRFFTGIMVAILFQVALIALFLFVRDLSGSRSIALSAVALVGFNLAFLKYGSRSHYQSLSFVFLTVFLFLSFRRTVSRRGIVAAVPLLFAWTMTHHVSVLMALALTSVPIALWWWFSAHDRIRFRRTTLRMYSLLLIGFASYYVVVTTQFKEVLTWLLSTSPAAAGLSSTVDVIEAYDSIAVLISASIPFYLDHIHFSFWLGFSLLGLWVLFTSDLIEKRRWQVLLAGFVPAAVLYYPSPGWILLQGIVELGRWQLMLLPFLVVVPALGVRRAITANTSAAISKRVIGTVVLLLVFTSLGSGLTNPGLTDFAGIDKEPRRYLSDRQIAAAEWTLSYAGNQTVHSDSELPNYIEQYSWARSNNRNVSMDQSVPVRASYAERRVLIREGLTVFSVDALREEGVFLRIVDIDLESYSDIDPTEEEITSPAYASTYRWNPTAADTVYTNGGTVVVYEASSEVRSDRSITPPDVAERYRPTRPNER